MLLGAISAGKAASAKELDGLFRLFGERDEQAGQSRDTYSSLVEVRWNHSFNPVISYSLGVRYIPMYQQNLFSAGSGPFDHSREVEPRFEIRAQTDWYSASVGGRFDRRLFRPAGEPSTRLDEDNLYARFATSVPLWPTLRLQLDRRTTSGSLPSTVVSDRALADIRYGQSWWEVDVGEQWTRTDRGASDISDDSRQSRIVATVNRSLADGGINILANYSLDAGTFNQHFPTAAQLQVPQPVLRGLLALNPTPLHGALDTAPALVDGNETVATSANIGGSLAGGSTDWNLGAELALAQAVSGVSIWIDTRITVEAALVYRFEVYRSDDNLDWTLVTAAPQTAYDPLVGRFVLTFAPVRTRFLKVVNVTINDALGALFVTEISIFSLEIQHGTSSRGTTRNENASAAVSFAPHPAVLIALLGGGARIRRDQTGTPRTEADNANAGLNVSFQPGRVFSSLLSAQYNRDRRTSLADQIQRSYTLTLASAPLPDLSVSMVATRREDRRGADAANSLSYLMTVSTLLYRDLSASIDFGKALDENLDGPPRSRRTFRAALAARPRPEIQLSSYLSRDASRTLGTPEERESETLTVWTNRMTVRPSDALNVTIQAIRTLFEGGSNWRKSLQLDWLPIRNGALLLTVSYRDETNPDSPRRALRDARLRWNMNRKMSLELASVRQASAGAGLEGAAISRVEVFFEARL